MYKIYNNSISYSGNNSTLTRLSKLLNLELTDILEKYMIGIHAFKFGKILKGGEIFILIIGGTDINEDIYNINKINIILNCCNKAKYIVAFNKYIYEKLTKIVQDVNKIKIIPQSIIKMEGGNYNLQKTLDNKYNLTPKKIFLWVGNLRTVKDPLFLKDLSEYFEEKNYLLIFIGSIIEGIYNFPKNFIHLGPLCQKDIICCYQQSNGLINTSLSEGMSTSILEAMMYKCPVFARDNEGNRSIIINNYNGYLFSNSKEFKIIIEKPCKYIISNAYDYVIKNHNSDKERTLYNNLIT